MKHQYDGFEVENVNGVLEFNSFPAKDAGHRIFTVGHGQFLFDVGTADKRGPLYVNLNGWICPVARRDPWVLGEQERVLVGIWKGAYTIVDSTDMRVKP